jgi:DNA-directed RNA polymerase specialized sigma24 family protein
MDTERTEFEILWQRVRDGCPRAQQELYDRFARAVLFFARRHLPAALRPLSDAEDLAQTFWATFFSNLLHRISFRSPDQFRSFLAGVVRNLVLTQWRRNRTQRRDLRREVSLLSVPEDSPSLATWITPLAELLAREEWEACVAHRGNGLRRTGSFPGVGLPAAELAETF